MTAYFEIHQGTKGFSIIRTLMNEYRNVVRVDYHAGGVVWTQEWDQRKVYFFERGARRFIDNLKKELV